MEESKEVKVTKKRGRPTNAERDAEMEQLQRDWDNGGRERVNREIVEREYGDSLPYNRERVESEAKFYMGQSAVAMFELGRRLILLKEHEPHGEFLKSLERLGVVEQSARRIMQATTKVANRSSLSGLGVTKIYELSMLDDEKLEALDAGETVAGLGLDEIDRMTTRELREALRKLREKKKEEAEIHEQMLADKNKKIDEVSARVKMIVRPGGWHVLANELNASTTDAWNKASEGIEELWGVYGRLINEGRGEHKENLERALPMVILHLQWHAEIVMESAQRLVDMIRERLPMPWHPINLSDEEITAKTKVEDLVDADNARWRSIAEQAKAESEDI